MSLATFSFPPPRTLVVVATTAALAVGLAGCSSSDDATVTSPTASSAPAAPATSGATAMATDVLTRAPSTPGTTLEYPGEDGATALELLKRADPTATWTGSGKDAFVTTIQGQTADDAKHEFWALYVNGKQAQVGAGSLVTKDGDEIQWKLETY